jgi:AcrR family transcriptional regulator
MSVSLETEAVPSSRRQATRERLLDAAIAVFAEEGVLSAPIETIVARAGFTRGAFYSNFETKEQLFLALLEREFRRRAAHLEAQAEALEPALRAQATHLTPAEVAHYIGEFFAPETDAATWFLIETEFLLLAMRDPSLAPGYLDFTQGFYRGISGVVEQAVELAGRRFTLPVDQAIPVLASVYERSLRSAALSEDRTHDVSGELAEGLTQLLFAITEPLNH